MVMMQHTPQVWITQFGSTISTFALMIGFLSMPRVRMQEMRNFLTSISEEPAVRKRSRSEVLSETALE
uniref:MFS transporter n=1 Tax=Bursaphelenchus xylophilus TaxID=6326 RepID=A0A1I7SH25_BURXY